MAATESESFGVLLRRYRIAAELTQEELAERAGLSVRGISDLERGVNQAPYVSTVSRLIEALSLSDKEVQALEGTTSRRRGPLKAPPQSEPMNLPAQPTSLIGRERDEAAVIHLFRWEGRRLVTLTGPGGVGKTRLALQVASVTASDFTDGAAFVPLAAVRDSALVLPTLAAALGVRDTTGQSLQQSLTAYLQDREILLVLDNLEHVLDCVPMLAQILAECPRVKALVTSRSLLHLRGEQGMDVGPLSVPPSAGVALGEEILRYPSVALFLERARSARPDFTITPANSSAVAEVCRQVDGLPLAIELAAARLRVLSPEALAGRLERRLGLQMLTGGTREVASRQQTMRDTIAWSHDLLTGNEQVLFRRLSVFAGGFSVEAAEDVCFSGEAERPDVFGTLASLVDQSLLVSDELSAGDWRLRMLETTKEYAGERLEAAGEIETTGCRHAQHFVALAESAESELRGPEQHKWMVRLETERDNVRAALQWSIQNGDIAAGLRLAGALWWFWYARGYLSEGRRWLGRLLEDDLRNHKATPTERARALKGASALAAEQGDYAEAVECAEESLALFRELGDARSVGTLLNVLGNIAKYQVDYVRAVGLYMEALALFRNSGDKQSIAVALNNLGSLAKEQGDHKRALDLYEESLAMKRDLGDKRGIAIVLNNIGTMANATGDDERAAEAGEESVELLRQLGDKDLASALDTLARAVMAQGNHRRAGELYREGLQVSRAAGEPQLMAFCLEGVGRVTAAEGNAELAVHLYAAGVALREAIGAPLSPAEQELDAGYLDAARRELGTDLFAAAWKQGVGMSVDQAVDCALRDPV